MKKTGFTLVEIMAVIAIVGLLTILGIVSLMTIKESGLDKEAVASLKQMNAAERFYYLETGSDYYPPTGNTSNIDDINQELKLDFYDDNWNYYCDNVGCVQATRKVTGGRTWRMCISKEDKPIKGACPSAGGSACPQ